jgi:hypothetical protein
MERGYEFMRGNSKNAAALLAAGYDILRCDANIGAS